jgi:hypothetical protein
MTYDAASNAERFAELVGGDLRGTLSESEQRELDALCAADASAQAQVSALRETMKHTEGVPRPWDDSLPPARLREAVIGLASDSGPTSEPERTSETSLPSDTDAVSPASSPRQRSRNLWRLAAAAAVCALAGAGLALGGQALSERPPQGPPGTLGAEEDVEFVEDAADIQVEGFLVAHTWGTETVLEMEGLPVGEEFEVVLVDGTGQDVDSGTFLGTEVDIDCRMNGAVLREDVQRVEVRSVEGALMAAAEVPVAEQED